MPPPTALLPERSIGGQQEGWVGHQGFAIAFHVDLQVFDALVGQDRDLYAKGSGGYCQGLSLAAWYAC